MNGTTVHGSQSTDPTKRRTPQAYYVGTGRSATSSAWHVAHHAAGRLRVGVAGLGGGALAAYVGAGHPR